MPTTLTAPHAIIGSIGVKLSAHWTAPGAYVLQARSMAHDYPRSENVVDALALLGVTPEAAIEPNTAGMFARVVVTADELEAGNAVAVALRAAADVAAMGAAAVALTATTAEA